MAYTPYQAGMTTGGTWSYVSGPTLYPTAPATYDGDIDFATYDPGFYTYRYMVTSGTVTHTTDVTINWQGDGVAPANDTCAGARNITGLVTCPGTTTINISTAKDCAGQVSAPTDSGVSEPAEWTLSSYSGDVWYKIVPPVCSSDYTLAIDLAGQDTSDDAQGVAMQVLIGSCGSLTSIAAASANSNETEIGVQVNVPHNTSQTYYIRVVAYSAGRSTLTVACNSECAPGIPVTNAFYASDAAAGAGGIDIGEIYYLSADNIYGPPWGTLKRRTS